MYAPKHYPIKMETKQTKLNTSDKLFYKNPSLKALKSMPFMGLKDRNGISIHFGDILRDEYNNLLTPVCEISNEEHILFFKPLKHLDKSFCIGCKSTYSHTLEIISSGNIILDFTQESCNIEMSK